MIATPRNERTHLAQPAVAASAATTDAPRLTFAHWGLAGVLVLFAYEWLLSGLNKALSASFRGGLAANLESAASNNPNHWYARAIRWAVLPHAAAFATLVEIGELLVAMGLLVGAVLWLTEHRLPARWARLLHLAVVGALLGSALMSANYYLMAGHAWPWLMPDDPFDEGLSIDGLLTLISIALLVVQINAWRARRSLSGPTRG